MMLRRPLFVLLVLGLAACHPAREEAPPPRPTDRLLIPGGRTLIGDDGGLPPERPAFEADVASFLLDRHPVTVARFRAFVEATGYRTQAEAFGDAAVFDLTARQWRLVPGATWHHPLGPDAPPAPDDHPVTQVSWHDAQAFCTWAGGRLPTEVEWEHAARGAQNRRHRYAWGDTLAPGGRPRANTWNGTFPLHNANTDGYRLTSPVGAFGATDLGLTDLGGNVWEWTASWYRPYAQRGTPFEPTSTSERVQRGGSFLCEPGWCHGYRVSARSHATPESALFHVGFRCAADEPPDTAGQPDLPGP